MSESNGSRPVIVCTDKRGVFFGYATETSGDPIVLERARMCVYWSRAMKGVLGLASKGPDKECRIGEPVSKIELRGITAVIECDAEAVAKMEASPWQS